MRRCTSLRSISSLRLRNVTWTSLMSGINEIVRLEKYTIQFKHVFQRIFDFKSRTYTERFVAIIKFTFVIIFRVLDGSNCN